MRRATLLVIRQNGASERYTEPILPLISKELDVFHKSPLYHFLNPGEDESEVASSFMGPGPWTIRYQLRVPDSYSILHPSNQTKGSNVMINHKLKVTLTVEREDVMATGKKVYDIIVHMPIRILSVSFVCIFSNSSFVLMRCLPAGPLHVRMDVSSALQ